WTHAKLIGQGESLLVVGRSWLGLWGIAMHGDVAEESEDPCLGPSLLALTGERQGLYGEGVCLRQVTGTPIALDHPTKAVQKRATGQIGQGSLSHGPFQHGEGLGNPAGEG